MKQYQIDYDLFMANYKKGVTSAEDIGTMIAKQAQHFADCNLLLGDLWEALTAKAKTIHSSTDDITGKSITSAKAAIMVDATEEAIKLNYSKIDRENIEQYINALKSLQKGLLNEYSHM